MLNTYTQRREKNAKEKETEAHKILGLDLDFSS